MPTSSRSRITETHCLNIPSSHLPCPFAFSTPFRTPFPHWTVFLHFFSYHFPLQCRTMWKTLKMGQSISFISTRKWKFSTELLARMSHPDRSWIGKATVTKFCTTSQAWVLFWKGRIRNTETFFFYFKHLELLSGSQRLESRRQIPKKQRLKILNPSNLYKSMGIIHCLYKLFKASSGLETKKGNRMTLGGINFYSNFKTFLNL